MNSKKRNPKKAGISFKGFHIGDDTKVIFFFKLLFNFLYQLYINFLTMIQEPDFIYCLFSDNKPPMRDMLPIFHNVGDCFYFNSVKYRVLEIQIANENDLEEIGWDDYQPLNPPLLIFAEECDKINYVELIRDLKLNQVINDDH